MLPFELRFSCERVSTKMLFHKHEKKLQLYLNHQSQKCKNHIKGQTLAGATIVAGPLAHRGEGRSDLKVFVIAILDI